MTVSLVQKNLCEHCFAKGLCFVNSTQQFDYNRFSHRVYRPKDVLIRAGEPFVGVYVLRSGAAKSIVSIDGGHDQIIHFHYFGELLGTDGFQTQQHQNTVVFLDTSSVCFFKHSELRELMDRSAEVRTRILRAMSKEIAEDHQSILSISQLSSQQRLARFILEQAHCHGVRGLSDREFKLVMTYTDIANHLGLAIETVSRLFRRFQQDGAVRLQRPTIEIVDFAKLEHLCDMLPARASASY